MTDHKIAIPGKYNWKITDQISGNAGKYKTKLFAGIHEFSRAVIWSVIFQVLRFVVSAFSIASFHNVTIVTL